MQRPPSSPVQLHAVAGASSPALPAWREYLFPCVLACFFAVIGTFPYGYGYATAPEGKAFMGFVGRGTCGLNGYLMFAKQVQDGQHLLENRTTPEPLPRTYFNIEWWLFGIVAKLTGLSLIVTFHLDRIFTVFFYCLSLYYLAARCLPTPGWRQLAVALITLGSGLGWVLLLATSLTGLELPQTFDWPAIDLQGVSIFAYLVNQPHFVRAAACAALTYAFLLDGERTGKLRYFVFSGLAAFAHSMIRPYHIAELYLVYALFPVLLWIRGAGLEAPAAWRRFMNYGVAGLAHSPAALFYLYLAIEGTLGMAGWRRQSRFLFSTVLWMGLPFLLVCVHFAWNGLCHWRSARPATLLLGLWLGIAWLLVNTFPFFVAGHEAAWGAYTTAPVLLALIGPVPAALRWLQVHGRGRLRFTSPLARRAMAGILVLACMPSSVYAYARMFTTLHHPVYPQHYYLDKDTLAALRWLEAHSSPEDVVLASHNTSQYIPRFSHNKVVTYHDMLTANYAEKTAQVKQFFANQGDDAFKRWLVQHYNVRFILYGPEEREEGAMRPEDHPWMQQVLQTGQATVWAVQKAGSERNHLKSN
ncbi:MAG: hypothetical protein HYV26_22820 [Candidatus Hydrogenedentes bacterium]|nr:hypothetical protein [Candidatus Hydrogenedentota bacterium]